MTTSTKPILNLITTSTSSRFLQSSSSSTDQINLNTFAWSEEHKSFIQFIQSFLSSSSNTNIPIQSIQHHQLNDIDLSVSLPPQTPSDLYHLLDRLLLLIQSLTNQLQASSLAQVELSSHLKISQSNLILAESTVYDLEKVIHKLQQPSPTSTTTNNSKRRDRVDSEPDVGIYGRLNLFRFGKRSTLTNIKPTSSSSPSPLSSPLNLSSSSSSVNCSSASSQSSFTSVSSVNSTSNEIEKLKYETSQLKHQNQLLRSSLENVNESKRQIECELETLSIELFEEANRMVRDERIKFVSLETELTELKNQIPKLSGHHPTGETEEIVNSNHTPLSTITPKNARASMIMTPERTSNELMPKNSRLSQHSPTTMSFMNPRLSNRFSKLMTSRPMNTTISDQDCEVQQTSSPEPDIDLSDWYRDLDKERSSNSDVGEEAEESKEIATIRTQELTKAESRRNSGRLSSSSSLKEIEDQAVGKRLSSSSSIIPEPLNPPSRPSSSLSLKPLLLNTNTPILARLQTDPSPKRHSSLNYHFHPRIRSPLSNQINKRCSSFNVSSTLPDPLDQMEITEPKRDTDQISCDTKIMKDDQRGEDGSKNGLNQDQHLENHLDLDSLLASIVDCAESLGFQDELEGIFH